MNQLAQTIGFPTFEVFYPHSEEALLIKEKNFWINKMQKFLEETVYNLYINKKYDELRENGSFEKLLNMIVFKPRKVYHIKQTENVNISLLNKIWDAQNSELSELSEMIELHLKELKSKNTQTTCVLKINGCLYIMKLNDKFLFFEFLDEKYELFEHEIIFEKNY